MKRQLVLIVEDSAEWSETIKDILGEDFNFTMAQNSRDAQSTIKKKKDIKLAIVDIRLSGDFDVSGLAVLKMLYSKGIPSIATSAYGNAETVREAFAEGGVKNFWFKDEKLLSLHKMIQNALESNEVSKGRKINTIPTTRAIWAFTISILFSLMLVFATLTIVSINTSPDIVDSVIISGVLLFFIIIISLLLFINKITNKDFREMIKEVINKFFPNLMI